MGEIKTAVMENQNKPIILCGDFNTTPETQVHQLVAAFLSDTWALAGKGPGYSFRADHPEKRIDYIWITPDRLRPVKIWVPATLASDHLPVMAEFSLK